MIRCIFLEDHAVNGAVIQVGAINVPQGEEETRKGWNVREAVCLIILKRFKLVEGWNKGIYTYKREKLRYIF